MRRVALLAAAMVATACTTTIAGAPVPVVVDVEQQGLAALIPTPEEIADILDTPPLVVDRTYSELSPWAVTTDDRRCMSAIANTVTETYEGANYVAVFGMVLNEAHADDPSYDVDPAAVEFSSPSQAQAYVDTISANWQSCANTAVTYTQNGITRHWMVHDADEEGGVWATVSYELPEDWACSRAIGALATIVADVRACGYGMDEGSADLAHDILSRVANV